MSRALGDEIERHVTRLLGSLYCLIEIWQYLCSVAQFSRLFVVLWTIARQAPLSVGFPRQEYWNGALFPTPRDLHDPGMGPIFLVSPALAAVLQSLSRVQLCDPMDCSMPGFLVLHHPPEFVLHW